MSSLNLQGNQNDHGEQTAENQNNNDDDQEIVEVLSSLNLQGNQNDHGEQTAENQNNNDDDNQEIVEVMSSLNLQGNQNDHGEQTAENQNDDHDQEIVEVMSSLNLQGNQNDHGEQTAENQSNNDDDDQEIVVRDLEGIITKMEERLERLLKYAFVLVNLYYFFQGIVLTAVSQVSSTKCHYRYFFFALSLIPFLLNGVPLIHVVCKYVKLKNAQDQYNLLHERRRDRRNGEQEAGEDVYRKGMYYLGLIFAAFVLVAFNVAVLIACNYLLCEHNEVRSSVDYDGDCFSVCDDRNKCLKICTA